MVQETKGKNKDKKSIDRIFNKEHNDIAGAKKVTPGGVVIDLNSIYGNNSATAQEAGECKSLRVVNTDAVVHYIGFGDSTVASPSVTTGAALLPGSESFFNTGELTHFRTDSNLVQVAGLLDR